MSPALPPSIKAVPTSVAAFVGRTRRGPTEAPALLARFSDFERLYGGLADDCPLSHAVQQFFDNGGTQCHVARVIHRAANGSPDEAAPITDADLVGAGLQPAGRGLWLLDQADPVNILCIPPLAPGVDVAPSSWDVAIGWARSRRAFVIVDAPASWTTASAAARSVGNYVSRDPNAAIYFPRLVVPTGLHGRRRRAFAPCGAVAGVFARTDGSRGVWKAPAGTEARLDGVAGLNVAVSGHDNGLLNRAAVNALRSFPGYGPLVWGARTLAGEDGSGSEWKYIPSRRLALHIEESLDRGLRWTVFEAGGEPLWVKIRAATTGFMQSLFLAGAFQGAAPKDAYFVRCGLDTTSQAEIARGTTNLLVGFAALKPAEFLLIRLAIRTAVAAS
ncbi:MAG TPA: phage tail sheath subtilisin-like domain-containing protein [Steroidobacteraceae bacterium]|nr:phage tail sheath subtilisin-like domain-containing protein [Steroidobacteraceae bacterium]